MNKTQVVLLSVVERTTVDVNDTPEVPEVHLPTI